MQASSISLLTHFGASLMTDRELKNIYEKDWCPPIQNLKSWKYGRELDG